MTAVWRRRLGGEGGSVIFSGIEIGLKPCRFGFFIQLGPGSGCSDKDKAPTGDAGSGLRGGDGVDRKSTIIWVAAGTLFSRLGGMG